jgi:hypothetical protein
MKALRIVGWTRYLHADCKRGASKVLADGTHTSGPLAWVKCPTSHTGLGFLDLMDHPDGMAHFGAWVLILETAARCPVHGTLITDGGRPLGARELALKTRGNADIFAAAISRLLAIGWLEEVEMQDTCKQVASRLQAGCKQVTRPEERRGEEIREDNITTTRARDGGVVEVDPDKDEDDPAAVLAPQPPPAPAKPPVCFGDWVMNGHNRIAMPFVGWVLETITHPHFGPEPVRCFSIHMTVK